MSDERDELDKLIREVVMKISFKKEEEVRYACPAEEELACYLEDLLSGPEKRKIEEHFLACDKCLEEFLTLHKVKFQAEVAQPFALPKKLAQRLKSALPEKRRGLIKSFADSLLGAANSIKSLLDALVTIDFSPAPIRGKVASGSQDVITFIKPLGDLKLKLRVEKVAKNKYELLVRAFTIDDRPIAKGLRVGLFQQTRELASYSMQEGEACFEEIRPGRYKLRVMRNKTIVGEFPLSFKGE